jgi:hypothetical protein
MPTRRMLQIFLPLLLLAYLLLTTSLVAAAPRNILNPPDHTSSQSGTGTAAPQLINPSNIKQVPSKLHGEHPAHPSPVKDKSVPIASTGATEAKVPPRTPPTAPVVNSNFNGIGNTGWSPSDSTNASGPNNVVETVNEQFTIYDRSGNSQYSSNFQSWFGQSSSTSLFDPRIVYDFTGGRFILLVDTGSSVLVSVAQQSNAIGNWCNYTFPTIAGFADYPSLGVDQNGVYFSLNMFNSSNSNELFKANRSAMESCSSASYSFWSNLNDSTGNPAFTIAPAVAYSSAGSEYLVSSRPGGACSLTLWTLTNSSITSSNVPTVCYSPPSAAAQQGSSTTIETLDNRIYAANYLNGQVDVALTGGYNWGSGNVNSVVWWFKINTNATLAQQGGIGTPGYWYFFPAIEQDSNGNAIIVYNTSSSSSYVNVWYGALSASGSLTSNNALVWGSSSYGTGTTARWGDYESARLDPTNGTQIWICGQYAAANNVWGTQNGNVTYQ